MLSERGPVRSGRAAARAVAAAATRSAVTAGYICPLSNCRSDIVMFQT